MKAEMSTKMVESGRSTRTQKKNQAIYDKLNGSGEENIVDAEVDERGDAPD
jgi:hypothetical protein